MRFRVGFAMGFAAGFVAGTAAGRERFEQMKGYARRAWGSPGLERLRDQAHRRTVRLEDQPAAAVGRDGFMG